MTRDHVRFGFSSISILAIVFCSLVGTGCSTEQSQAEVQAPKPSGPNEVLKTFSVEGMTCEGCESHVCEMLKKVPGVKEAKASHTAKKAWVIVDKDGPAEAALTLAIKAAGDEYKVQPVGN